MAIHPHEGAGGNPFVIAVEKYRIWKITSTAFTKDWEPETDHDYFFYSPQGEEKK